MYLCNCKGFTYKDVNTHLENEPEKTSASKVYTACSEDDTIGCCKCIPELKQIVKKHNNTRTIGTISDQMQRTTKTRNETTSAK